MDLWLPRVIWPSRSRRRIAFPGAETTRRSERGRRKTRVITSLAICCSLIARAPAATLAPGVYIDSGHAIYVGVEHTLPDPASNDFFDPSSQRTGELRATHDLQLRSA